MDATALKATRQSTCVGWVLTAFAQSDQTQSQYRLRGRYQLACLSERYERTTTVVTSNLDYEEWDQAFAVNRLLGLATLYRLRHNAYCLKLDRQSYRAPRLLPKANKPVTNKEAKSTIGSPLRGVVLTTCSWLHYGCQ
jgi:hypothetical protein